MGVLPIREALEKAREKGLDLIEIAPQAKPPVVKIEDFGKFKYREEKKLKKQKPKASDLKEVRLSPFIGDHDYQVRLGRIKGFLKEKHKVKVVVVFKGRHMGSKEFGYKLLGKILEDLGATISIDMEPKFVGRHLAMVISPTSKKKDEKEESIEKIQRKAKAIERRKPSLNKK